MQVPEHLEDLLDRVLADYSDEIDGGGTPDRRSALDRVPPEARPGLERCLKAIDAGSARAGHRALGPGTRLGRFELVRELGRGGMALVFLAKDPDLRRAVALKVLRPGLALEQAHVDRFLREGHAMARLQHPGVVQVFEVGATDGMHWIAMEHVEGPSLATVIEALGAVDRPGPEDLARAAGAPQLADAPSLEAAAALLLGPTVEGLAAAHEAGLVHRDIKPSNILIHPGGRAVLADFGLARAEGDPALSMTGAPIGTPHYMAPEQAESTDLQVDARTDVYGFGVTLYELLSQTRPFDGTTLIEVLDAIRERSARPLRAIRRDLGPDAEAVCAQAMQRDPARRYASADELSADLLQLSQGLRTLANRRRGGPLRRLLAGWADTNSGRNDNYRSSIEFLGLPLLHVVGGHRRRGQPIPVAKGWIAVGPKALGGVAIGGMSFGAITLGGISCGLFSMGGVALGLLSLGGTSVGVRAFGGMAVGDIAAGGVAVGRGAIGGLAVGKYPIGEGKFQLFHDPARDPSPLEFFDLQSHPLRSVYAEFLRGLR